MAEGLWELVARGLVTADGFGSARALFSARERWARRANGLSPRGSLRRSASAGRGAEGRWSLLLNHAAPAHGLDVETLAEAVAEQLLARYGVVFRDLLARETLALPWREILRALRRLEARGTARGGRFVTGFVGEQYALPEAVEALRSTRRRERTGEIVRVTAVDPLNLVGILTPGPRVPALGRTRSSIATGCRSARRRAICGAPWRSAPTRRAVPSDMGGLARAPKPPALVAPRETRGAPRQASDRRSSRRADAD